VWKGGHQNCATVLADCDDDGDDGDVSVVRAGVRLFPGVGDAQREHRRTQRLQVHRTQRLQRSHHVCGRRPGLSTGRRQTRLCLPHHRPVRPLQYHHHRRTRLRTQGAHASATYAVVVCLSVCLSLRPSVCHKPTLCRNDWTNRAGFWHGGFLPPILHCVIRKFGISKNKGTSLSIFIPNSGLRKVRGGKLIVLSTKLVDGRVCWRRSTRRGWTHIVYYTSVDRNPVTPLLWFAADSLYNLFLQLLSSWLDFDWHSASRGPSTVAELVVQFNSVLHGVLTVEQSVQCVSFFVCVRTTTTKWRLS